MVTDEMIEKAARAMCLKGGFDPYEAMPNDGPRWKYYVDGASAALEAALSAAEPLKTAFEVASKHIPEARVSLLSRAIRQGLNDYGWKNFGTLPEVLMGYIVQAERAEEAAHPQKPRDCGHDGGDLSERRDNIGSAYTRSALSAQVQDVAEGWSVISNHGSVLIYCLKQNGWRKGEPVMVNDVTIRIENAAGSNHDLTDIADAIIRSLPAAPAKQEG